MPAQNVAGSMIARQIRYRAIVNSAYPESVLAVAWISAAVQPNELS